MARNIFLHVWHFTTSKRVFGSADGLLEFMLSIADYTYITLITVCYSRKGEASL